MEGQRWEKKTKGSACGKVCEGGKMQSRLCSGGVVTRCRDVTRNCPRCPAPCHRGHRGCSVLFLLGGWRGFLHLGVSTIISTPLPRFPSESLLHL